MIHNFGILKYGPDNAVTVDIAEYKKKRPIYANFHRMNIRKIIQLFTFSILWKTFVVVYIICMLPLPWCRPTEIHFNMNKLTVRRTQSNQKERRNERERESGEKK